MAVSRRPAGTVTLVFTDIEGSTRLLDTLGAERYGGALAEHQRVVRAAFGRHDGYEVDTFFYSFPTAAGAASADREAPAALDGRHVRIRAGIHTGEPVVESSKYVGLNVHRAARIMEPPTSRSSSTRGSGRRSCSHRPARPPKRTS